MEKYIDLHIHSKYSDDGEFTPIQLVEQCYKAGIKIMSIADRNSVKAIDEAKVAIKNTEITGTNSGLTTVVIAHDNTEKTANVSVERMDK